MDTPSVPGTVPALIVTHADLADALVRAAERVVGPFAGVTLLSNEQRSRAELEAAIAAQLEHWPQGGVLLTDFWGGSCHTCAASAGRRGGEMVIVTGVNLPMLLDYLHNRDKYGPVELAERLQTKGRESIRVQRSGPA
jgi:mannose/fructose-specific phosphotransferase system component IIA